MVQDNTDNNVQDLKNQLAAERQKAGCSRPRATAGHDPALADCDSCAAGSRRCHMARLANRSRAFRANLPQQHVRQQSAAATLSAASNRPSNWRPRSASWHTTARFASNLVYARPPEAAAQQARRSEVPQSDGDSRRIEPGGFHARQQPCRARDAGEPASSSAGDQPPSKRGLK